MGRRRGECPTDYWPSKVNRGWGGAGRQQGGPREGAESALRAAARRPGRPRRGHCEPSRAAPIAIRPRLPRAIPAGGAALRRCSPWSSKTS